jgi:hypothetical protein
MHLADCAAAAAAFLQVTNLSGYLYMFFKAER